MEKMRLDRFLSAQCGLSRSEARAAIRRGLVTVGGSPVRDAGLSVDAQSAVVQLRGETVVYRKYLYLLLNKPAGILSASSDKTRQTVIDLVPPALRRPGLFPVGRLDRDTTGLLILTDDGDFAHRVISPRSGIQKCYLACLDGAVTPEMCAAFRDGVILADGSRCRPALLEALPENRARLVLSEGKYHEVKRMFGTVGLGVTALHRESIGELVLPPGSAPGKCTEIPPEMLILALKTGAYTF